MLKATALGTEKRKTEGLIDLTLVEKQIDCLLILEDSLSVSRVMRRSASSRDLLVNGVGSTVVAAASVKKGSTSR